MTSATSPAATSWDAAYAAGRYAGEPPVSFTRDILAAARKAMVTSGLYRHYAGKDELAAAALRFRDKTHLDWLLPEDDGDGRQRVRAMFDRIARAATSAHFRGCPFLRASLELPAGHPAQGAVAEHRHRLHARLCLLAARLGAREPDALARQLMVLADGAASGCAVQRSPAPARDARELALVAIVAATAETQAVQTQDVETDK